MFRSQVWKTSSAESSVRTWVALVVVVTAMLCGSAARAQDCAPRANCAFDPTRAPARPVPEAVWGALEPVDGAQVPAARDTTNADGYTYFDSSNPQFVNLEVDQGLVFVAFNSGFQIWDATGDPSRPVMASVVDGRRGDFPDWGADPHITKVVNAIGVAEGRPDLVVLPGASGVGATIWDTSDPALPRPLYQDSDGPAGAAKQSMDSYAAMIGGRVYGFVADSSQGLVVYDASRAREVNPVTACVDHSPVEFAAACEGVYLEAVGERRPRFVAGVDELVVTTSGGAGYGIDLWNMADPHSPVLAGTAASGEFVYGVAMWNHDGERFVAANLKDTGMRIYRVSCLTPSSCSFELLWSFAFDFSGDAGFATASKNGNTPFVYFGSSSWCDDRPQAEFLFDVTDPANPVEVTPEPAFVDGCLTGYWGWYNAKNPTGFNNVAPYAAAFWNGFLYRTALSIFDVHRLVPTLPPPTEFTWNSREADGMVYPGSQVDFFDQSGDTATSWAWTFSDGNPATSTVKEPSGVTFASAGLKDVTLTASNDAGGVSRTRAVQVVSPVPAVLDVAANVTDVVSCQPVTFSVVDASGKSPVDFEWVVVDGDGDVMEGPSAGGETFVWRPAIDDLPGLYVARVTLTNTFGSATASSDSVTVRALQALPEDGAFSPSVEAFGGPTVSFNVHVEGATEWSWDFGDGTSSGWIDDPELGPNATHTYASVGVFSVSVVVRNCASALQPRSAVVQVEVRQLEPFSVRAFEARGCTLGHCVFRSGKTVVFDIDIIGVPQSYDYDWDGDGFFEDRGHVVPVVEHRFDTPGTYHPALRINSVWTEQAVATVSRSVIMY